MTRFTTFEVARPPESPASSATPWTETARPKKVGAKGTGTANCATPPDTGTGPRGLTPAAIRLSALGTSRKTEQGPTRSGVAAVPNAKYTNVLAPFGGPGNVKPNDA